MLQTNSYLFSLLLVLSLCISCEQKTTDKNIDLAAVKKENTEACVALMEKHLQAVSHRDLTTLKSTLPADGKMQLILPGAEIFTGVDAFVEYHEAWFQDTTWTFETKILHAEVDNNLGSIITEVIYREPERDGKPYFNRMSVSYVLKKIDDAWYVIKDHASSIEKSTDKKQ